MLALDWSDREALLCSVCRFWGNAASLCARTRGEPSSARCGESWLVCGLPGWGGVTSLCARSRGEPSSAHCEQRLSERLTPCPCDPVCACTGIRGHAFLPAHPHAAQRAVPGWRGGLGRVGADLASAGSMRPPPSPARHVSTAWLATTHVSQENAVHQRQPQHTCLVKIRMAAGSNPDAQRAGVGASW